MSKKLITEIVIKELPDDHPDKSISVEKLFMKYWVTGRSSNILRLSKQGYEAFLAAGLQEYSYKINTNLLSKKLNNINVHNLTLKMGKLFKCPWYFSKPNSSFISVSLFDSKVAMFINLYGSIENYLELKV